MGSVGRGVEEGEEGGDIDLAAARGSAVEPRLKDEIYLPKKRGFWSLSSVKKHNSKLHNDFRHIIISCVFEKEKLGGMLLI